jgi:hypothetical protein
MARDTILNVVHEIVLVTKAILLQIEVAECIGCLGRR